MNRLQFEKSPYLLQHKTNPVDWYPWGSDALDRAAKEDKPILLSIGYSSCHWCHVMEQESFTDPVVANYMNQHFINIKLDREERPDLDKIYMDAVVSISGSGGWPLNCFLLPDKRPFYGGTYFPPAPMHQRPSWSQILQHIVRIFKDKRSEVEHQADRLIQYVTNSASTLLEVASKDQHTTDNARAKIFEHLKNRFDQAHGGFGGAPKFPSTMSFKFLLDHYFYSGQKLGLLHVFRSLELIARGGIFDQIGGGFARYTTDQAWRIPHFEKMLYDNALFLSLYSQAYKISPRPIFKKVISQSAAWLFNHMKSPVGGYYSAIDADSEHEEGKYYVWNYHELKKLLGPDDFRLFETVYDVRPEGNWADPSHPGGAPVNILWVRTEFDDEVTYCSERLQAIHLDLLAQRDTRVSPLKDTKIITSWNALLCMGWFDAFEAFEIEDFLKEGISILTYLEEVALKGEPCLHQYESDIPAMLDDLAFSIMAFLHGYRTTGNKRYLNKAEQMTRLVLDHYFLPAKKSFRYSVSADDLVAEVNDLYDSTMPSATGAMAFNLVYLGRVLAINAWEQLGNELIKDLRGAIVRYPDSLSYWASLLISQDIGWIEVKASTADMNPIRSLYLPLPIIHFHQEKNEDISLCHQFSCEMPVNSIQEFRSLLDKHYHLDEGS